MSGLPLAAQPQLLLKVNPTPYTIRIRPYTPRPTPHTLHPTPYTLHPTPYTQTPSPTPYTLHHTLLAVQRDAAVSGLPLAAQPQQLLKVRSV